MQKFLRFIFKRKTHLPPQPLELLPNSTKSTVRQLLGRWGEETAARALKKNGYRILYRNFRATGGGEIDIVCRDRREKCLVFVEVKTRSSQNYGRPVDAVDSKKQRLIVRGAMAWLRMLDMPDICFRFDVVEIIATSPPQIEILKDVFQLPDGYTY